MQFITLNKIEGQQFDTATEADVLVTKPCVVNASAIRCFYGRRGGEAGSRITFTDGGGFAVTEPVATIARLLGVENTLALAPPVSETAN